MTDNRQQICQSLCGHQNEIQKELEGTEVEVWEADSACGLSISNEASVDDSEEKREATRTWLLEHLAHFKAAVQPRLDQVMAALRNLEPAEDPTPTEVISSG